MNRSGNCTQVIIPTMESRNSDSYIVRITYPVCEAAELKEAGFEYTTGEYNDGGKIYKKHNLYKFAKKAW